jgi:hypothetical protein
MIAFWIVVGGFGVVFLGLGGYILASYWISYWNWHQSYQYYVEMERRRALAMKMHEANEAILRGDGGL